MNRSWLLLGCVSLVAGMLCLPVPTGAAAARTPAPSPLLPPGTALARAIEHFGGRPLNPFAFPPTTAGFSAYLTAAGVHGVVAADLIRPHRPDIAKRLGYRDFLPEREWWTRGAALALLTERLEREAGAAVVVRNWWRPRDYNAHPAVGGAPGGDHPTAHAVDVDYPSPAARIRAERYLRALRAREPWLRLSLGLGPRTTHVGIDSPRGAREWHYAGWTPAPSRAD